MEENYWRERWQRGDTPWDMGSASPALIAYCQQLRRKELKILIPGAGSGYEVDWLWTNGFQNVFALDFSEEALGRMAIRLPDFPAENRIQADFFALEGQFDLILEQTFLSAIHPERRLAYAEQLHRLLVPGGTVAGVLFDFPLADGPPFGGDAAHYRALFAPWLEVKTMAPCYNSIPPRSGRELFFILRKRIL